MTNNDVRPGLVKWYNDETAVGFLIDENTGNDVRLDPASMLNECEVLVDGQRVWFELIMENGRAIARKVRSHNEASGY